MITDKNHQKSSTEIIDTVIEQTELSTTAGNIQKVAGDIIKGENIEEQNKDISDE